MTDEYGNLDPRKNLEPALDSLDASECVRETSRQVCGTMADDTQWWSGKEPDTIMAASIYVAGLLCDDEIKQTDIANATGVSAHTIRTVYREVHERHQP